MQFQALKLGYCIGFSVGRKVASVLCSSAQGIFSTSSCHTASAHEKSSTSSCPDASTGSCLAASIASYGYTTINPDAFGVPPRSSAGCLLEVQCRCSLRRVQHTTRRCCHGSSRVQVEVKTGCQTSNEDFPLAQKSRE